MVLVINYINQFNRILRMKLVLKFNEMIRLYSTVLQYDNIAAFARKEFNIKSTSLQLSFLDEDNDQITILSNEDIQVMQAVFEGKEYVKINVKGEINNINVPKVEPNQEVVVAEVKQIQVTKPQEPVQIEEVKIEEPPVQIKEKQVVIEQVVVQEQKREQVIKEEVIVEGNQEKKGHCNEWKKKKFQRMEAYLNQTVAKLVDQRIKALLPCLKEQILNQAPIKLQPKGLVHEGFECKACLQKPIVGIRYQCPTCPQFSLCQDCQTKIDHEHNLLKIKKIIPKQEQKVNSHCLRKWFGHGHHGHHGHHGRHGHHSRDHHGKSQSQSKERHCGKGPHWFMKKCWGLSTMFGGKPEDYKQFVNDNEGLKPRETYKKYAELKNVCDEDFRQKFIDMRCQKLQCKFGKPAESYKAFVETNFELKFGQLMRLLEEKGEKHVKKCWGGKRYNFNQAQKQQKVQCPFKKEEVQVKVEKVEQVKKLNIEVEVNPSMIISEVKPIEEKKESTESVRQKGAILMQMQEIFGEENTKAYYRFIDEHFSKGLQAIIQLWVESQPKLSK